MSEKEYSKMCCVDVVLYIDVIISQNSGKYQRKKGLIDGEETMFSDREHVMYLQVMEAMM